MRVYLFLIFSISVAVIYVSCNQTGSKQPPEVVMQQYFEQRAMAFDSVVSTLQQVVQQKDAAAMQAAFAQTRLSYKQLELLLEYFSPYTARFVNGAPVPEAEPEDDRIIAPRGLQVIEGYLFPAYDSSAQQELEKETAALKGAVNRIRLIASTTKMNDGQIWDAMRQQLYRIITLGIAGYDVPLLLQSIPEAAVSLETVHHTYRLYFPQPDKTDTLFISAVDYLHQHPDFKTFDRFYFIKHYANPLSAALLSKQLAAGIKVFTDEKRAADPMAPHLFAPHAIRAAYFTNGWDTLRYPLRIALGKKLFYDNVLSGTNTRNCGSCHQPEKAFTDGLPVAASLGPTTAIMRNTPTLLNAALQPTQFYDQRVAFLEDQATAVIENKDEMHGSMEKAVEKLRLDKGYAAMFKNAFPGNAGELTSLQLQQALGAYIRSLVILNSRFDKAMNDELVLTVQEQRGFNIFMGKAKCGTCHFMPLFNGTLPPLFDKQDAEVLGVPRYKKGHQVDPDEGKYKYIPEDIYKYAFKTPTVRNVARTAPYMHNGVFSSLEEVMTFYNNGGGAGIGIQLDNQTLPADSLKLTPAEQADVIAFMRALTDSL